MDESWYKIIVLNQNKYRWVIRWPELSQIVHEWVGFSKKKLWKSSRIQSIKFDWVVSWIWSKPVRTSPQTLLFVVMFLLKWVCLICRFGWLFSFFYHVIGMKYLPALQMTNLCWKTWLIIFIGFFPLNHLFFIHQIWMVLTIVDN